MALTAAVAALVAAALWQAGPAEPSTVQAQAITPACAEAPEGRFVDVPSTHRPAADCLGWWGVARGVEPAIFAPSASVTRAQMASLLTRAITVSGGQVPDDAPTPFDDVVGSTHEPAVAGLAALDVISGVDDDRFAPDRPLTRGQLATLLAGSWQARTGAPLGDGEALVSPFDDVVGDVHEESVVRAAAAGLVLGVDDGSYAPRLAVTRGQVATAVARLLAALVEAGHTDPTPPDPVPVPDPLPVFGTAGEVDLHLPADEVEMIGYHQANHRGAQQIVIRDGVVPTTILPSRGRGTGRRTAADVVAAPGGQVRSPVTGTVRRAGTYQLYCRYPDHYVVIEPDARPGWEVKVLHFRGLRVAAGDRVAATRTVLGREPREMPFGSQVDDYSSSRDWPHLHLEVVDPSVPTPSSGSC